MIIFGRITFISLRDMLRKGVINNLQLSLLRCLRLRIVVVACVRFLFLAQEKVCNCGWRKMTFVSSAVAKMNLVPPAMAYDLAEKELEKYIYCFTNGS